MKKSYPSSKSAIFKRCIFFVLIISGIIYSCKKDASTSRPPLDQQSKNTVVTEAKTWFERNETINNELPLTTNAAGSVKRRWSDALKPDWNKTAVYSKDKGTIIEMPLFSSAVSFLMHTTDGSRATQHNNYTKATYLIQKDSAGVFKAWFMVLVADTSYINGDFSKLDRNTYRSKDAAYSGRLLYFDLRGKFLAGWKYDNGIITSTLFVAEETANQQQVNSQKIKVDLVQTCNTYPLTTVTWECITVNFNNSNPDLIPTCTPYYNTTYITQCTTSPGGGGGGGSGGGGGGSGGGGSGGSTPPPTFPPPPPPPICPPVAVASVSSQQINTLPGGSAGGGGSTPTPCTPAPPNDPCAQAKKQKANGDFKNQMTDLKNKVNLNYEAGYLKLAGSSAQYITGVPNTLTWNVPQPS